MEDQEVLVVERDFSSCVCSSSEKFVQQMSSCRESENLGVDLLEDLDEYWDDINDRLTISRMVSDSVIKGMVKAVEQMAEEKIAAKELEVATLKEMVHFHQLGFDKSESLVSTLAYRESRIEENGLYHSFSDAFVEQNKVRESLGSLRSVATAQIMKLKRGVESIRGCGSMRRISSGSELVGLGGILQEKASESLVGVDKTFDTLKVTVDAICTKVDEMVNLTQGSLGELQQEQEFKRETEAMVLQSSIRSLCEEIEGKLWDQNSHLCGSQSMNVVSNLRKDLDAILKSMSKVETGQLISHGSHDMDHFQCKALSNHVSPSTSLLEGNGIFDDSKNGTSENWDAAQLKHMTKEEIVNYFNRIITEMRRNHESKVQQMTEQYFSLKREYLKEKGSSFPIRKDNDLDALKKKIPQVILKLDDILAENKKLYDFETLGNLKDRLNSLLLENRQLRDSLSDKRKEVKFLSSQVSDAAKKMLKHSLAEANLLALIENLKSDAVDAKIVASITDEVYECFLTEMTTKVNYENEVEMLSIVMQDIYEILYREAVKDADAKTEDEIGDSDIDSLVMQWLCGVIFTEAIKDAASQFNDLNNKYLNEKGNRDSLELKVREREEELKWVIKEKERLEQQAYLQAASIEEKEKLEIELTAALVKERERFEQASKEMKNLKDHTSWLQRLVMERNKELDIFKGKLAVVLEQMDMDKIKISKLNKKLEIATMELREADEGRNTLLAVTQEKQNAILLLETKDNVQRKQMQVVIGLVHGLSSAFSDLENQVAEGMEKINFRLEESRSQLGSLMQQTRGLKETALLYKRRLDRRCNDLQLAEAEVDLLGDEVDTLLDLLEKIYIALDHYSPVLHHYTGVTETLKLIKRELNRESSTPI